MTVNVDDKENSAVLIIEREKVVIPLNVDALQFAQDSKKKLNLRYKNALLVYRNGKILPINHIEVLGFWGSGLFEKLKSILFGVYEIKVHFGNEKTMTLKELKELVIECIGHDCSENGDPYLPQDEPLEIVFDNIRKASNFNELFESINFPELEDCLDVL